jgi:DNA-directed RNA polymerase specialized sigma24 family protein
LGALGTRWLTRRSGRVPAPDGDERVPRSPSAARPSLKRVVHLSADRNEYEAVEARSVAVSVLGSLPPRQRAAVVLTEGLGYSAEEAGRMLGIKGSTVRALRHEARSSMRRSTEAFDG